MKLQLFTAIQSLATAAIACLQFVTRPFQALRVWAWHKATAANLASCNQRQASRTRFV